jgi:AAA+ ATPase superfamily predicted ATPase
MFVNREEELQTLEDEYNSNEARFTVIYGRRRVGKTALITRYIKDKNSIYLYATTDTLIRQLENFTKEIAKLIDNPYGKNISFKSFDDAFEFLSTIKLKNRLVLVIDEYQNLCQLDKSFSSMLQRAWDLYLSKANIHLILCGSVVSMIYSEVLSYSSPLYGRRTTNIRLLPLLFRYIKDFVPNSDKETLMKIYSSFGTIPKYLNEYNPNKSFIQNIKEKVLNKDSYLYSEGNFLLKEEFGDGGSYFAILESISKGNTKIGTIASSLSKTSTSLAPYIQRLIELDIVEKELPITETNSLKSRLGRYKIKDKFLNFWFYYVYKNYNQLEIREIESVVDEIEKNFNDRFVSFAFEEFVREDLRLNPEKYIDFIPKKVGRWWNNKEEIDIIAMDDKNICFIECKWQNSVNKKSVLNKLIQKSQNIPATDKKISYLIVTKEDYLRKLSD